MVAPEHGERPPGPVGSAAPLKEGDFPEGGPTDRGLA